MIRMSIETKGTWNNCLRLPISPEEILYLQQIYLFYQPRFYCEADYHMFLPSVTIGWCFDDALIRVLLANMVPSQIQSFCETLRAGVCKIAIVAGSFTVAVLLPWVHWWSVGIMVFNILILIGFVLRRKQLIHLGEIPLMDNYTSTAEGIKVTYGFFSGVSKD